MDEVPDIGEAGDDDPAAKEEVAKTAKAMSTVRATADAVADEAADKTAQDQAKTDVAAMEAGEQPWKATNKYNSDYVDSVIKTRSALLDLLKPKFPELKDWDTNLSDRANVDNFKGSNLDKSIQKYLTDTFGDLDDKASLQKAIDRLNKLSEKATDGPKREGLSTMAKILGALLLNGLAIAGGLLALFFAAQAKCGCYAYQPGVSQATKLDCNKPDVDTCSCKAKFTDLQAMCSTIQDKQTCVEKPPVEGNDGNWIYVYRHYNLWDVLNDVIQAVGDEELKAGDSVKQVLDFFAKYGIWFFIGIAVIILLVIGVPIIKSAMG